MTLHLGLPHGHLRSHEHQQDLRQARKMLKEHVRDDWDFPVLPQYRGSTDPRPSDGGEVDAEVVARLAGAIPVPQTIAGFRFHPQNTSTSQIRGREVGCDAVEWREREYSSDDESDDDNTTNPGHLEQATPAKSCQLQDPDAVRAQISNRKEARKRRRGQLLHEEMEWNQGLKHWVERRDVWCAARTKAQVQLHETEDRGADPDTSSTASAGSTSARTSASTNSINNSSFTGDSPTAYASPSSTPDSHPLPQNRSKAASSEPHFGDLLVPVASPLLPNHPIRRRISASMYSEIYTKIIGQSRTPSVPINLHILITALVKGWKDDGEWPPKSGVPEPSVARKKGSGGGRGEGGGGFRNGVKAVGRVLRLTSTGS